MSGNENYKKLRQKIINLTGKEMKMNMNKFERYFDPIDEETEMDLDDNEAMHQSEQIELIFERYNRGSEIHGISPETLHFLEEDNNF